MIRAAGQRSEILAKEKENRMKNAEDQKKRNKSATETAGASAWQIEKKHEKFI